MTPKTALFGAATPWLAWITATLKWRVLFIYFVVIIALSVYLIAHRSGPKVMLLKSGADLAKLQSATLFSLFVDRKQVEENVIKAGKKLHACPPKMQVEIRAVFCGDGTGPCIAIFDVADTDAEKKLKAATKSKLSLQKTCE